ncbi:hypothetical protein KQX54_021060 [Cotesia glomerata]|uniref:Uncharacterized protein n=1 Tax=Cotesia glomerata TaxID=32391 RepID=A0AAV7I3T7_COTGL|nr:hypothetical protein KQX54_021060 [Cotesia glomerata]
MEMEKGIEKYFSWKELTWCTIIVVLILYDFTGVSEKRCEHLFFAEQRSVHQQSSKEQSASVANKAPRIAACPV